MEKETGKIEEIKLMSLPEALKEMQVGETKAAPSECSEGYVRVACSDLNKEGYYFRTFMYQGKRLITRVE